MLGALVGSFLATLVIRWPAGTSVAAGRSQCDACQRTLGAFDLVPVLSFAMLRGRCRICAAPIDRRHVMIETGAALIGGTALAIAPDASGLAGALFGWILLALAALDAEHFWLPDALVLPLGAGGLMIGAIGIGVGFKDRVIGVIAGYAVFELIRIAYRMLRGRDGLGGGDPKLLGAIGAWLGWQSLPFVVLGASGAGLIGVAVLIASGRKLTTSDRVPLGTLMAGAAFIIWCGLASSLWTVT